MGEPVVTRIAAGFADSGLSPERWDELLATGETDTVFLTWHWQRIWWESFGRGELLLSIAERAGRPVAIAPLFADAGMLFFVGSGGSDYLDFIGDLSDPVLLANVLGAARQRVSDFVGFRFYHVPAASSTGARLAPLAERLGLTLHLEGEQPAPRLRFAVPGSRPIEVEKESLRRHEKWFTRQGELKVVHASDCEGVLPYLEAFMQQHVMRWAETLHPSLFREPVQRDFYRRLAQAADEVGWIRFTRVEWNGRAVAFHFGFSRGGTWLWYKPSFAIGLARSSPGEVLLRHLLLAAAAESCHTFDFGLGDEPFKRRFASEVPQVQTWGLYP